MRAMLVMEMKLVVRDMLLPLLGLLLPLVLFVGFGALPSSRRPDPALGGLRPVDTVLPSMALTVAIAMVGFVMLPAYLAGYRERGILRRLATTPVRPRVLLTVQLVIHVSVFVLSAVLMLSVGVVAFGMAGPRHVAGFLLAFVLSMLAMFALGLVVASVVRGAKTANGAGMMLWLGSAFFAGIYVPREYLPAALGRVCDFTPLGAARQAMQDGWGGPGVRMVNLLVLAATAGLGLWFAAKRFRWE
jgi:ABC-2 type transport system permease protein